MNNEEHLQEQVESGKDDGSIDSSAYRKVFDALKKDASSGLSANFADRVVRLVEKTDRSWITGFELTLAIVAGMFLIAVFAVTIVLTNFKPDFGFLNGVSGYRGVFIFGVVFVTLIHFLDKKISRKKLPV